MTTWQGHTSFCTEGFNIDRSAHGNIVTADRDTFILPLDSTDKINKQEGPPIGSHWRLHVLNPVMSPKQWQSIRAANYGDDFIYERVWLEPIVIDAGFITEEADTDIIIWNAFQFRSVQVTSVTVQNETGTSFDIDSVPINMSPTNERGYVITVLKEGPSVQNTTYRVTIDSNLFEIVITGMRVISITQPINMNDDFNVEFEFKVAMFQTEEFIEQRTPMYMGSWVKCNVTFQLDTLSKYKLYNRFVYGKDKIFGIPMFMEPIIPTSVTSGNSYIGTSTDTTYLWNLRNKVGHVIIVDHNNDIAEIKAITTVSQYQINLDESIIETFTLNATMVYPIFFGYLEGLNVTDEAAKFGVFKANFKEFKSG